MASSSNAVENNNKLFPIVANKLSQRDPKVYETVAQKFAQWLSNEKAYYAAARPEIIKLLGIAHLSLRRAVHADVNPQAPFHISTHLSNPMTKPYSRLLKAVYPYKHLFVEEDLKEQLRSLLNTISAPNTPSETPPASSSSIAFSQSRSTSLARHGHITTMQASSSSLASALEMRPMSDPPHGPVVYTPSNETISPATQSSQMLRHIAQASTSDIVSGPASDPRVRPATFPQRNQSTIPRQGFGQVIDITHEIPAALSHILPTNATDHSQPSTKPKKKKKRPLPSDILAKDIEELNRKRSMQQAFPTTIKQEPVEDIQALGDTTISTTILDPPVASKDASAAIVQSPIDNVAVVDEGLEPLPSNEVPLPLIQDAPSSTVQSALQLPDRVDLDQPGAPATLATEEPSVTSDHMVLDQPDLSPDPMTELENPVSLYQDQPPPIPKPPTSDLLIVASIANGQHIIPNTLGDIDVEMTDFDAAPKWQEAQTISPSNIPTEDRDLRSADLGEPMAEPVIGHPRSVSTEADSQANQAPKPPSSERSLPPQAIIPTPTDPPNVDAIPPPLGPTQVPATSAPAPPDPIIGHVEEGTDTVSQVSPVFANTVSTIPSPPGREAIDFEGASNRAAQQPMKLPSAIPVPGSASDVRQSEAQGNMDAFGSEMRILAFQRGLQSKSKFTIRFEIPQEQYTAIQLWNNRNKSMSITDLKQSLCLSLGCYTKEVSKDVTNLTGLSTLPSHWPQAGELFMNALHNGKRKNFSLSPPFQVFPNGLVDVSKFLQPGSNIIELNQRSDMRGYVFILRAHYPTQSQLEEVAQRQAKKKDWQDWLHHICRPLDVPIPVFS